MEKTSKQAFLGPWELFEVLEEEFADIRPLPPGDSGLPWRVEPEDIRDPETLLTRLEDLLFLLTSEKHLRAMLAAGRRGPLGHLVDSEANAGASGGTDTNDVIAELRERLEELKGKPDRARKYLTGMLNRVLSLPPDTVVELCHPFLVSDRGRALQENAPDEKALAATEGLRERFNRQALEAAFEGALRPAADRALERLFERADAPPTTAGATRWALCLSGGGIRSASFSLGVLQALARHRNSAGKPVLERFDYMSTVSGGGYIGGWLSAWISRAGRESVFAELGRSAESAGPDVEPDPVRHLRSYSNFLSPRKGVASPDMWTLWTTILRNLLLAWLVVLPMIASALLLPVLLATAATPHPGDHWMLTLSLLVFGAAGIGTGVYFVHTRRPSRDREDVTGCGEPPRRDRELSLLTSKRRDQRAFLRWCLLPICAGTWALFLAWTRHPSIDPPLLGNFHWPDHDAHAALLLAMAGSLVHITGWVATRPWRAKVPLRRLVREGIAIVGTGAIAGVGVFLLGQAVHAASGVATEAYGDRMVRGDTLSFLNVAGPHEINADHEDVRSLAYTALGVPSVLLALALGGFLYVGFTSRGQFDEEREWSARYSAWLLIVVVAWSAVCAIVFLSGWFLGRLPNLIYAALGATGFGWLSAWLGKSPGTESSAKRTFTEMAKALGQRYALALAAPVAVVLVLMTVAAVSARALSAVADAATDDREPVGMLPVLGLLVLILGLGLLITRYVDMNKFSLHAMYRMRLIRAYLGASRPPGTRRANPFTGFDAGDNLNMHCLQGRRPHRPIHVLGMALNMVAGSSLAWQDRKARPFSVSPYFAGAVGLGYRRTRVHPSHPKDDPDRNEFYYGGSEGISLGTAMAISGAAASPSMGYHSSPAVTFLMTLFNARLGWWLGNPGWRGGKRLGFGRGGPIFHSSNPPSAFAPIFRELLGHTTDSDPLIYLSDGGHFENLGLYEMVLRRCRTIVVVDGSCDERCDLVDLGNAIRKIRIDQGVSITFDSPFPLHPRDPEGKIPEGARHVARATIEYTTAGAGEDGVLFYVKPALTGDEPRDIHSYSRASLQFPHESTADQFFDEAQFESYRALGSHSGDALLELISAHQSGPRRRRNGNGPGDPDPVD